MVSVDGQYFDGRQPIAVPATLEIGGGQAKVTAGPITAYYAAAGLKVSARTGTAHRFIALPDGGQLLCEDGPGLDSIARESPSEGPAAWLEARWGVAVASVLGVAAALLAAYVFVLPVVAERLAARIPLATEQALGREALDWLDGNRLFSPTGLDAAARAPVVLGFDRLREGLPLREHYRLEFRASKAVGPNAFALPGGIIVVTDALVHKAESPDEVLAVLAHEIAHVELRHAMRGVIQGSVVAVVAATVTADAASLNVAIAGLPALLAQTKYSRKFEGDADAYAFRLLKQKGYSPAAFATFLERLSRPDREKAMGPLAYTSTHPVTAERVKRAHEAATEQ
jgi:Zn-dependent protease with chaperone function